MTSINELQKIISYTRSLTNNKEKLDYLNTWNRRILNFLSGNIKKDGIAKKIASEIPIFNNTFPESNMESIILSFKEASKYSRKKDKIRILNRINLTIENKKFVLTSLYGSFKLGLKIPIPDPEFGDIIKPQLCGTGIEFNPAKMMIEEKFDGIRCIATNNDNNIILQSRNGKILDIPIIKESLINAIPPGTTIDGEIIADDGQFQSLERKSNHLIYMIFDIIFKDKKPVIDQSLTERRNILYNIVYPNDYAQISQELDLFTMDEIDDWITKTTSEGIVAKYYDSPYIYGGRKNFIKFKNFQDWTCKVISYTDGEGRREGILGAINVIPEGYDTITKVGSGFSDDDLLKMKNLIDTGKDITVDVKFQNWTADARLRFPTFLRIRTIEGEEI